MYLKNLKNTGCLPTEITSNNLSNSANSTNITYWAYLANLTTWANIDFELRKTPLLAIRIYSTVCFLGLLFRFLVTVYLITKLVLVGNQLENSITPSLLAIVDTSSVQSSAQTFIYNAILFIDTSDKAWHNQAHWLIGTPYLSTIASNGLMIFFVISQNGSQGPALQKK